MPILDAAGRPVRPARTFDFNAPIRAEKPLSQRSAEILRSVTLWEMVRRLSPLLVCKHCYEQSPDWSSRDKHTVEIASNPDGAILAQCACTSWVCPSPVPLDASDIPTKPLDVVDVVIPGVRKPRPIGTKEARLLIAWRQVMIDHNWMEILWCMDCQRHSHDPLTSCQCAVIPDKSVTIDCECTERRWTGITK